MNAGPDESTFYPAAWHDIVSLTTQLSGSSIPVSANATLCAAILAWVASCVFLCHCILPDSKIAPIAAGILSASFSAFPGLALDFGVLYPNLLGIAITPVAIGLGIQLLKSSPVRRFTPAQAIVLLALVSPGIALAHPNAVMTIVVIATAAIGMGCIQAFRGAATSDRPARRRAFAILWMAMWLATALLLWSIVRPPESQLVWQPFTSFTDATGQGLLNAPLGQVPAWIVSCLVCIGLYRLIRRGENAWLGAAWVLLGYCWIVIAAQPFGAWRLAVTGVWYTDPYRVAIAMPLVCLPLAVCGVVQLTEVAASATQRSRLIGYPVAAILLVTLTLVTQNAHYMNQAVDRAKARYETTNASTLLTSDERTLISRISSDIPSGALVATNPWNGSSLVYPLAGVQTTTHHATGYENSNEIEIRERLNRVASDDTVCAAVNATGVSYVLDFGDLSVNGPSNEYPGFTGLAEAPGFELVDSEGDARLYRITVCTS